MALVSGKLLAPDGTPALNSKVKFELVYCGGNLGRIIGTGTIVPPEPFFVEVASDGTWSTTVFGNDKIVCGSDNTGPSRWRISYIVNGEELPSTDYQINSGANPFTPDSSTLCSTTPPGNINCTVQYPYVTPPPPPVAGPQGPPGQPGPPGSVTIGTPGQGYFFGPGLTSISLGSSQGVSWLPASNKTYAIQFELLATFTIRQIVMNVTAGSLGNFASFGIYSADGTQRLLYSGLMSVNASGIVTATIPPVILPPGVYWLAFTSNGAPGTLTIQNSNTPQQALYNAGTVLVGLAGGTTSGGALPATLSLPLTGGVLNALDIPLPMFTP
jgi:hypothetical protein